MKGLKGLSLLALALLAAGDALADTVVADDGRVWKGLIVGETPGAVRLDLGFDVASIGKETIVEIRRSDARERAGLERELEARRRKRDVLLGRRDGGAKEVPLLNHGGHVAVEAVLNGRARARLMLDTGSTATILSPEIAEAAGLGGRPSGRSVTLVTSDGRERRADVLTLDTLDVGGVTARDVDVIVVPQKNGKAIYGDGLLGVSYLSRFDFKIDYRRSRLVLDPNGRAGAYDAAPFSG